MKEETYHGLYDLVSRCERYDRESKHRGMERKKAFRLVVLTSKDGSEDYQGGKAPCNSLRNRLSRWLSH